MGEIRGESGNTSTTATKNTAQNRGETTMEEFNGQSESTSNNHTKTSVTEHFKQQENKPSTSSYECFIEDNRKKNEMQYEKNKRSLNIACIRDLSVTEKNSLARATVYTQKLYQNQFFSLRQFY